MKVLIKSDFRAVMTGEFVTANIDRGEFIFDTDNCDDLSVATLLEIARKNKAQISKGKKEVVVEELFNHINKMELPVMKDKTESQIVSEIVAAGVEAGKNDNDMLIEIVEAGIKFKSAGKMFNRAMIDGGHRITAKDRKAEVRAILVDAEFAPESYDELQAMIERISNEVDDTTTSQANTICKSYAKEFEIELPKAPKKLSGGINAYIMSFLESTPTASKEELLAFVESKGPFVKADRGEVLASRYEKVRILVNNVYKSAAETAIETAE